MQSITCYVLTLCFTAVACSGSAQNPEPNQPQNTPSSEAAPVDETSAERTAAAPSTTEDVASAEAGSETAPAAETVAIADASALTKEEVLEATKAFMIAFAEALKGNAGDCDAMAAEVEKLAAEAQPVKARMEELQKDPATKAWLEEEFKILMPELAESVMDAIGAAEACKDNERMQRAMESLG